jgi:hypothetical protein
VGELHGTIYGPADDWLPVDHTGLTTHEDDDEHFERWRAGLSTRSMTGWPQPRAETGPAVPTSRVSTSAASGVSCR